MRTKVFCFTVLLLLLLQPLSSKGKRGIVFPNFSLPGGSSGGTGLPSIINPTGNPYFNPYYQYNLNLMNQSLQNVNAASTRTSVPAVEINYKTNIVPQSQDYTKALNVPDIQIPHNVLYENRINVEPLSTKNNTLETLLWKFVNLNEIASIHFRKNDTFQITESRRFEGEPVLLVKTALAEITSKNVFLVLDNTTGKDLQGYLVEPSLQKAKYIQLQELGKQDKTFSFTVIEEDSEDFFRYLRLFVSK
jgi:hypothetical protein